MTMRSDLNPFAAAANYENCNTELPIKSVSEKELRRMAKHLDSMVIFCNWIEQQRHFAFRQCRMNCVPCLFVRCTTNTYTRKQQGKLDFMLFLIEKWHLTPFACVSLFRRSRSPSPTPHRFYSITRGVIAYVVRFGIKLFIYFHWGQRKRQKECFLDFSQNSN